MGVSRTESHLVVVTAILLGSFLLMAGCASAPPSGRFLLHPLPQDGAGYGLSAGALIYSYKNVEVEIRPLDQRFVGENLSRQKRDNPFVMPSEAIPEPLIFEVRLANKGTDSIYFNPANARGIDDDGERYLPQGFSDFYQMHRSNPKAEGKLDTFTGTCYDGPVELHPGQAVEKYLVFSSYETIPKTLTISLDLINAGQDSLYLFFQFEAFQASDDGEEL